MKDCLPRKDFSLWHRVCARLRFLSSAAGALHSSFRTTMLVDLQHQKHIISLHVMHGDYGKRLREKLGVHTVTTGEKYTPAS